MEFPNIDSDSSGNISKSHQISRKNGDDPCKIYEQEQITEFASFVSKKQLPIGTELTAEDIKQADPMAAGVSGAMKLMHRGSWKIMKPQVLTEVFSKNVQALVAHNQKVCHVKVSESDDSFAHFPRKELLGYRIACLFRLDVPFTELVRLEDGKYASLQKFLPNAISMINARNLKTYEVHLDSVIHTFLFHILTENIDGHTGNILLNPYDNVNDNDDDELTKYKAIPIDYGLIYPRHNSIYPKEFNLVKKGFFGFFKTKKINVQKYLAPIISCLETALTSDLKSLMTVQEEQRFQQNTEVLKKMLNLPEPSLSFDEFLDAFITQK